MRSCETCTKCCDGWLTGEAYGYRFWPGRKCHFVKEGGCSIYEKRPDNPCKSYRCVWLNDTDNNIPEWMRPDLSNVIMTWRTTDEISYLEVIEAGGTIEPDILNWVIQYSLNNNINLKYQIKSGWNKIGSQDFLKADNI